MEIKVLYFASAREEIGLREEKLLLLPDKEDNGVVTLATLRRLLMDKYPHAADTIESITLARNLEYSDNDAALQNGDEVALIPPISGG
ncbi:Molybdopterin synthase sulfur carrier subunit [Phytophthora citrophthora]|uniref:Molybdopterin synthase sulfur carrier subunit n=1 Tax=Phytophthora citrophthora TaxID=4793 RepID=A0AAD9GL53_9STRA|nr:Molybdopterin synthase sulfur carrier subunit [Phytophthora citrophthora]